MKYVYYAVAERDKPEDFRWLTVFAVMDHLTCSLPKGKKGIMDTLHYVFKPLSKAQFDTYIAFESLEIKDSDDFSIASLVDPVDEFIDRVGVIDVLDKPKS
jgi:hypothetical protein